MAATSSGSEPPLPVPSSSSSSASQAPQLHKYITLPFALHIDPLPSLHYQAVPWDPERDGPLPEADEDSLGYEEPHRSSIGSNMRLQPLVIQPSAHDLETLSLILENSCAVQAIPAFTSLLKLLDSADDDPHFRNLIEFFDRRYDLRTGRAQGEERNFVSAMRLERKTSKLSRLVGRRNPRRPSASAATAAAANTSAGHRPSLSLGQTGSILSPSTSGGQIDENAVAEEAEDDEVASQNSDPPQSPISPTRIHNSAPMCAPHLLVDLKAEPGRYRSVAFPVRLDLHNAGKGLCRPPPAPVGDSGLAMLRSNADLNNGENASPTGGLSHGLRRIISPGSSHSDSSQPSASVQEGGAPKRSESTTSGVGGTSLARQTSIKSTEGGSAAAAAPGRRRPSTLQRFLGLRSKSRRQREMSAESTGAGSVGAASPDFKGEIDEEDETNAVFEDVGVLAPPFSSISQGSPPPPDRDPALLLSDHLGEALTLETSGPAFTALADDRNETVFTLSDHTQSKHYNNSSPSSPSSPAAPWAGTKLDEQKQKDVPDFLALLRQASETVLRLPASTKGGAAQTGVSPKAMGKRAEGVDGDGLEEKNEAAEDDPPDDLFNRAKRGETNDEDEPWWPAGGSDPLPVAIFSALGSALGWRGVMQLCYGRGSPVASSGELASLGRAAAAEAASKGNTDQQDHDDLTNGEVAPRRTFEDWQRMLLSLSRWTELYEMTRVRGGLSREIGLDAEVKESSLAARPRAQYSLSSGTIPGDVVADATDRRHPYRRRMGIPDGLPATEDGMEPGDYRWSRSRLGPASVATPATLAASSLAHYFSTLATTSMTYQSAWELDYLEALVLKTPIIADRFPPPIYRGIMASSHPFDSSEESQQVARAKSQTCPNPRLDGSFDVDKWVAWLRGLQPGSVVTPVVSLQAWWSIIAILNGAAPGTNLQILAKEENWRDVVDDEADAAGAVYI